MAELYVATGDGLAQVRLQGGKGTVQLALPGTGVQCLAPDPHRPGTLYAGARGTGVWKTTDGGAHWQCLEFPHSDVFSVAVSPVDGTVYAGCEPSMLFRSPDGGRTWEELAALRRIPSAPTWSFPPRPWTSHVRWIAPSPYDAGVLLVGIELGGLMYSADGGQTWLDHRPHAQRDVHALAWHPRVPGRAYEAGGGGTAWSRDGGLTWERVDAGRDRHYTWALAVDPEDPNCWYVSASPSAYDAHHSAHAQAYIYRWRGAGPWQALGGGLPQPLDSMVYALTIGPSGTLYAGLRDGRLYLSTDHGDSWQPVELQGGPLPSVLALACLE
jgi:photosystem II stability/assembly factor-like uncharacterized protein